MNVSEVFEPLPDLAAKVLEPMLADVGTGVRVPLLSEATNWVQAVLAKRPARMCLFDYGVLSTVELARRGGWLRTYRNHERGTDPYVMPGHCDITTDIAVDQLPTPSTVQTQAEFLSRWGIASMVEEGRTYWKANAHAPDLAALKMRSRVSESEALLNTDGLGSWIVLEWGSNT